MILAAVVFLEACGTEEAGSGWIFQESIYDYISSNYPLYDTVSSTTYSDDYAEIYIAENQDIATVASDLQNHLDPSNMSELKEGRQIFIYDDQFVTLTQSTENPSNTLIEVASDEFVRDNYDPDFLEGFIVASVIDEIFDVDWRSSRRDSCRKNPNYCYGGYGSSGSFIGKNPVPPSVRSSSSSVRGGGTGSGK
ncbi:DUF4247 domain-containing protein [Bacillaceae bacterium Marseille-Q3522]|nr:DUF4247 domain-containing protein [Bacillaceae bacterium Marseille-Q3522]